MEPPPVPETPSAILTSLATYTLRLVAGTLGHLIDGSGNVHYLYAIKSGAASAAQWKTATSLPTGFGDFLIDAGTLAMLQGGTLQTNGSILYSSTYSRLASTFDGARHVAATVAA